MNTFCSAPRRCALPLLLALLTSLVVSLPALAQMGFPATDTTQMEVVSARMVRHPDAQGRMISSPDLAVSGRVIVEAQPGVPVATLDAALQRIGGRVLHAYNAPGQYLVALPEGMGVVEGMQQWRAVTGVKLVSPDRLMYLLAIPNDPQYPMQYHLPLMQCPTAWDNQTGSNNVVIGIMDSGVDLAHEDLAPRLWTNPGEIAGNGIDDDGNGYIDDVNGYDFADNDNDPNPDPVASNGSDHGTHVAGCAAAATNNGLGVAAPSWAGRIAALKVGSKNGGIPTSAMIAALDYAADEGMEVVNISIGGGYDDVFTSAISAAWAAGVSVVVAAGNSSWTFTDDPMTWWSPICNDGPSPTDNHVLGVGATDNTDKAASFTNLDGSSRNFIDVMSPGVDILSTLPLIPADGWTTAYGLMSGTSMASPVCAGVVALVRAQFPAMTPDAVLAQVKQGCENIDAINPDTVGKMGAGRINAARALGDLPPGKPRSPLAFDTPGDDGGSITLTWGLSADDGKGANDVIGYEILRAEAPAGPFNKIINLLKGTSTYADTDVIDYKDYYYQIGVRDAKNLSLTAVLGPVQAKDDLAPAAITVLAKDTPGDNGGSISLSWSGYVAPDDFLQYRIYRSEVAFSNIKAQGVTRIGTVANPSLRSYTDTTVTNNLDYWYAVTAVDDSPTPNELTEVTAVGPVRANPNFTITYPAGLSMIALGIQTIEKDLGVLLGRVPPAVEFARWDPALSPAGGYHLYSANPADAFLAQGLGKGYWMKSAQGVVVDISGAPATSDVPINFVVGWNQLGNPFDQAVAVADMRARISGVSYELPAAGQKGYLADYLWTYDSLTASYRLVSQSHPFALRQVPKGQGFFLYAGRAGQLVIPKPVTTAEAKPVVATTPAPGDWNLRLMATVQGAADCDNFLGISSQAAQLNGVVSPPLLAGGVDVYFPAEGGRRATSYRGELGQGQTWNMRVASAPGAQVHLSWPDLTELPRDCQAVLRDLATGKRIYLRTTLGYDFTLGAGETERRFTLEVSPKAGDLLAIRSLNAQSAAQAVQISYVLSAPATVSVDILNVAGRVVCSLPATAQEAGVVTALWNGLNASGSRAPAGTYLVRLNARGEDGQAVAAVGTLRLP